MLPEARKLFLAFVAPVTIFSEDLNLLIVPEWPLHNF